MNRIQWFTGANASARLHVFANNILGNRYAQIEMPVDVYMAGYSHGEMKAKALKNGCLFLDRFYHHAQFPYIYDLLHELMMQGNITVAVACEKLPPVHVAEMCNIVACPGKEQMQMNFPIDRVNTGNDRTIKYPYFL